MLLYKRFCSDEIQETTVVLKNRQSVTTRSWSRRLLPEFECYVDANFHLRITPFVRRGYGYRQFFVPQPETDLAIYSFGEWTAFTKRESDTECYPFCEPDDLEVPRLTFVVDPNVSPSTRKNAMELWTEIRVSEMKKIEALTALRHEEFVWHSNFEAVFTDGSSQQSLRFSSPSPNPNYS